MKKTTIRRVKRARLTRKLYAKELRALKADLEALSLLLKHEGLRILEGYSDHKTDDINTLIDTVQKNLEPYIINKIQSLFQTTLDNITKAVNKVYIAEGFNILHHSSQTLDILKSILDNHLSLIKTIPANLIESHRTTLLQAVAGFDRGSLTKTLTNISNVTKRRAELIARDQTAKAIESYSRARAIDLGFDYYVWRTVHDERVSTGKGGHEYLDNRVYSYHNPTAIIDSNKTKGHPGQRVNCRCSAQSVYLKEGQQVKLRKDPIRGDYYEVITKL